MTHSQKVILSIIEMLGVSDRQASIKCGVDYVQFHKYKKGKGYSLEKFFFMCHNAGIDPSEVIRKRQTK